jgi:hypothetical protein
LAIHAFRGEESYTGSLYTSSLSIVWRSRGTKAYLDLVILRYLESILCRAVWVGELAIGAAARDREAQFAIAEANWRFSNRPCTSTGNEAVFEAMWFTGAT